MHLINHVVKNNNTAKKIYKKWISVLFIYFVKLPQLYISMLSNVCWTAEISSYDFVPTINYKAEAIGACLKWEIFFILKMYYSWRWLTKITECIKRDFQIKLNDSDYKNNNLEETFFKAVPMLL